VELIGWRTIAADPVDFLPVPVEEKQKGSSGNIESLEDRIPSFVSSGSPVKDKILFQEFTVFWIIVVLLTQQ
jgi:hypothetical protein